LFGVCHGEDVELCEANNIQKLNKKIFETFCFGVFFIIFAALMQNVVTVEI